MRDGTTPRCPVAHNGVITSPSTVSPCCSHTMVPSHQGTLLLGAATPLFARGRKSCSVSKAPHKEPSLGEGCFVTPILAAWRMILELGLELSSPGIQAGGQRCGVSADPTQQCVRWAGVWGWIKQSHKGVSSAAQPQSQ